MKTNLRRAGRLLNSFEFHLGAFCSSEAEVNPLDFFVLKGFRLFELPLYQSLYEQGDRLFPTLDHFVSWEFERRNEKEKNEDPWEKRLSGFVKKAHDATRGAAEQLLKELFPKPGVGRGFYGLDTKEGARQRRLSHILYFNRYFRLTIDAWDIPEARISELEASMAEPTRFVNILRVLKNEGKLPLALTKFLARDKIQSSTEPVEIIGELCEFGDEVDGVEHQKNLIDPTEGLISLIELQLPGTLSSAERLERILTGIARSQAIHFPIKLAESEDQAEHQSAIADANEKRTIGPHLERADVETLNVHVAARLEDAVQKNQVRQSQVWVRSITWYLDFMQKRAHEKADLLLAHHSMLAVLLLAIINQQSFERYGDGNPHFAGLPLVRVKNCFGFDRFENALEIHNLELNKAGDFVSKRLVMYRDMRRKFSHLADPKPNPIENETSGR